MVRKPYETPNLYPKIKEKIMALSHNETTEELKDELDSLENQVQEEEQKERLSAIGSWTFSLLAHGLILLILSAIVILSNLDKQPPAIRITMMDIPPERELPEKPDIDEVVNPVIHPEEVTDEITIMTPVEVIEDVEITTEDMDNQNDAKGREDAVSVSEMGGQGVAAFIGAGGGASGAFGRMVGGDRTRIGRAFGPNARGVTSTLDSALLWLVRHQSPNGQWDSDSYWMNCEENPKMEPGGQSAGDEDVAMTGYSLLCFLGAGYDHKTPTKYRRTVQKGIEWLLATQQQSGLLGERNYEHPVAAMALAEAYAMTNDPTLREPTQRAVNIILDRQVQDGNSYPLGWDYITPKLSRMDSSVSVWNVFALKSAAVGGLDVGRGMEGSKRWLEGAWKAANPNWNQLNDPYTQTSVFPYVWNGENNTTQKDHLSFAGGCAAVFLGHGSGDIMLETLANDLEQRFINNNAWQNNTYCLYYSSLFLFQMGNQRWNNFMNRYAPYLIENNIKDENAGCRKGTWVFEKQNWHGSETSHILNHCYALLALEVAIRYEKVVQR